MHLMALPPEFTYLRKGAGRAPADVLEERYRLDELASRVVIRDVFHRKYCVFESWESFWAWRDAVPAREQCFDEVVFGAFPQRLKFDIDAPAHKIDAIAEETLRRLGGAGPRPAPELDELVAELFDEEPAAPAPEDRVSQARWAKVDTILDALIEVILDELHVSFFGLDDIAATRGDLIVADSSGPTAQDFKFSFHILVTPYAVANHEEAKGFTARVLDQLPAAIRDLVDPQVNKTLQNFRLAGSSKPNTGRVKEVTLRYKTAPAPREAAVVRPPPGGRVLSRLYTEEDAEGRVALLGEGDPRARLPEMRGEDLQVVLEAARRAGALTDSHELQRVEGSLLLFHRLAPSYCRLCRRVHDYDNTLMLTVAAGDEGPQAWQDPGARAPHRVVEHCRHAGKQQAETVAIVDVRRREPFEPLPRRADLPERERQAALTVKARLAALEAGTVDPHEAAASDLERLPAASKHVYAEPRMRPYETAPTLVVRAQMKLGKTRQLREYLDREYPRGDGALREPVVRFVTFRQTFSKSMQREAFPEFALYSDHAGDLDPARYPRLIVQVESLHRLPIGEAPEPVDLLVLDEVESILAQFNSGLHRHFNAGFAMFQWMLATAGRVVCMDANVGDRTLHVLEAMRPAHPPFFHWNQYRRAADDAYYFTADQAEWLAHLHARLEKDEKVVIPTNSLAEAETFYAALCQRFPGKAVRLYSSKTPQSEKERHFADVHAFWSDLDVLIYTPTVSAGVSFELEHFDCLFGYFTDASCDVETCRQMLGRVRDIATKDHCICLVGRPNNLPAATADIRRLVHDKRANLYRQLDDRGAQLALQFEYGPRGEIRYHESAYFRLWLETARVENLSKNAFVARFIDQVADTGAAVRPLPPPGGAEGRLAEIKAGHKALKRELAEAECAVIAQAPDLEPEEAAQVRERLSRPGGEVTPEERLGYLKHRLRDAFVWHGRPLTPAFVKAYQSPEAVRVYKNLCRITAGRTIVESLRLIQEQEVGNHRSLFGALEAGPPRALAEGLESRDLHHRYVFQAHFLAVWLLRLCGFRCITDPAFVREETMQFRMRAGERELLAQLEAVAFEFQLRCPSLSSISSEREPAVYVKKVLAVVNPVQRKMYGVEIRRASRRKDFRIALTKTGRLFVFAPGPVPDDAPGGPRPHVPSSLRPVGADEDALLNFLDGRFYDAVAARLDEPPPAGEPAYWPAPPPPDPARPCDLSGLPEREQVDAILEFLGA